MCQANSKLEQAQQQLVVKQFIGRLESVQQDMQAWSHLFGHLASPLTVPLHNAAGQLEAVLSELQHAEESLAHPAAETPSNVTFVSK